MALVVVRLRWLAFVLMVWACLLSLAYVVDGGKGQGEEGGANPTYLIAYLSNTFQFLSSYLIRSPVLSSACIVCLCLSCFCLLPAYCP